MTVSLEAMFLALTVLASQNRLTRQTDTRSHLDLHIDLLAEREMTAVLTDLRRPTGRMEELARTRDACRLDRYGRGLLRGPRVVAA